MSAFEEIVLIVLGLLLVGWTTMKVVSFAGCRRRRMARDPHQGLKNVLFVALWAIFIGLLLFSQSHAQCWEINDVFYCSCWETEIANLNFVINRYTIAICKFTLVNS
jgi:hypothetical protein